MKYIKYLQLFSELFKFKSITDEEENEYILFANSPLSCAHGITDRTAFEAIENHVHLVDNIKKSEFDILLSVGDTLGQAVLCSLKNQYPNKHFCVYISLCLHDSMIIRFHQKWDNEAIYYNPQDFVAPEERVMLFES